MKAKKVFHWFLVTILWLMTTPVFAEPDLATGNAQLDFCDEPRIQNLFKIAGTIIFLLKILIPVIIILLGTIDLFKAMISGDEKDISTSINSLIKRFVVGIVIFFIPAVIKTLFNIIDSSKEQGDTQWIFNSKCYNCLLDPNGNCEIDKFKKPNRTKDEPKIEDPGGETGGGTR